MKNLEKLKNHFDKNGFVTLKNFLTKKKTLRLKNDLFNYLLSNKRKFGKRERHFAKGSMDILNSIHHLKWPYIKKIRANKKLKDIIEFLMSEKIKNFGAEVFAKPPKVGRAVPIHQDNRFWNLDNSKGVTVWLALDKSNKKNGAIFYYQSSQKLGLIQHKPSYVPGTSQVIKNLNKLKKCKKVTPILNMGDALIHHCLVAHGSNRNLSDKSRVGLTVRYIGRSSRINKKEKKIYEKSLKRQLA